jgi:putative endonuclease
MTDARVALGKIGENLAVQELERRGYAILARRYRQRSGEIDIVARDGQTLVFVEVKARTSRNFGEAAESITRLKRRRIASLAQDFIVRTRQPPSPCRFDVVSICFDTDSPSIDVFQNAFSLNDC